MVAQVEVDKEEIKIRRSKAMSLAKWGSQADLIIFTTNS